MVIPILSFDSELHLKMKSGLDYANVQKDPNFFQCQLIIGDRSATHHGI